MQAMKVTKSAPTGINAIGVGDSRLDIPEALGGLVEAVGALEELLVTLNSRLGPVSMHYATGADEAKVPEPVRSNVANCIAGNSERIRHMQQMVDDMLRALQI